MADNGKKPKRHPALDLRVPCFRPMYRRVLTVLVIAIWTGIELVYGNPWWALLAGGIGAYAGYVLFFDYGNDGSESGDE